VSGAGTLAKLRATNLLISGMGLLAFVWLFAFAQFAPDAFDSHLRQMAAHQVAVRLADRLPAYADDTDLALLGAYANRLVGNLQDKAHALKKRWQEGLVDLVADILAKDCPSDCMATPELRSAARQVADAYFLKGMAVTDAGLQKIRGLVVEEFAAVRAAVRWDISIFSACNAAAFLCSIALSLYSRHTARALLPVSLALSLATVLAAFWYFTSQNWLLVLLFNDYMGWTYMVMLCAIFAVFVAILRKAGRIRHRQGAVP
jgi:hypothetical protein